ncbi:putative 3-oxoacyl-[acyl-carrier-protein] synthase I, chloroplastic [Cocos nucifera]|uniref:Auxin-responsive protein n=1 Tax=Cocos nucifera TaxID=13894 RepID=A0A8K0MZ08_COCNU|nr:putative 3-oxoacyl-[acyl-carrier-protein] synthase I, chloroplastic [Cocos nucifera]
MATSASIGVAGKELGVISEASSPLKRYNGLRPLLGSKQMASFAAMRKPNGPFPSLPSLKSPRIRAVASPTVAAPKREKDPKKRIVVTGIGLVSVFGSDIDTFYNKLLEGQSGISLIDRFDASSYSVRFGGQIRDFSSKGYIDGKNDRRLDDCWRYCLVAGKRALDDANLGPEVLQSMDRSRIGVLVGTGMGGLTAFSNGVEALIQKGYKKITPFFIPYSITNMGSALLAIETGLMGPNYSISTACATANYCFYAAANHIRRGEADIMVAGGTEAAILPTGVGGFIACRALSQRNDEPQKASRPWDKDRDGFVMGEGSGVLIMESLEHARKRGATIIAEYLGGAITCDAHHMTDPRSDGLGVSSCIVKSLEDAGVSPEEVNYVNAHATSTLAGDLAEVNAIKKSMIGHCLGAAGGLEAIATIKAITTGWLHPTINQNNLEPDVTVDTIPNVKKKHEVNVGLGEQDLTEELWRLCAGPLVEVPRVNERVFYFPQGHMEQLEASTNQELNQKIPRFNLPSKILCRVFNVQLRAEPETDEVYAQITLHPEPDQSEPTSLDPCPPETRRPMVYSFCQPRRHLLTTGWSTFVTSKRLVAGDAFVFLRFTGTVVGVEDVSSQWTDSKWRSLKVQWDEATNILRPDRISPWEIEPFNTTAPTLNAMHPVLVKNKRPRLPMDMVGYTVLEPTSPFWYSGTTHSHELDGLSSVDANSSATQVIWPCMQKENKGNGVKNGPGSCDPMVLDDWLKGLHSPIKSPPASLTDVSLKLFQDMNDETKVASWPVNPGSMMEQQPVLKLGNGVEEWKKPEVRSSSCRLFGIDLMNHSKSTTVSEKAIAAPAFTKSIAPIEGPSKATASVDESDQQQSGLSKASREHKQGLDSSPKEIQSKHHGSTRSRTKVHMQGMAVGRAVDLTNLVGYNELITELEQMFEIKGELRQRNKWEVVFTDDEGDMMLVGDDPWP